MAHNHSTEDKASAGMEMTPADQAALARAVDLLERTSFAARLSAMAGKQISALGSFLPASFTDMAMRASGKALETAMRAALASLDRDETGGDRRRFHRTLAAAAGAAGGALGLASLPFELPVSTLLMLRSIAAIARAEGENLDDPETILQCLQVFALSSGSDASQMEASGIFEGGYFALRGLLARSISEAAGYIAQKGVADSSAPALVKLLSAIAQRFGIVVSQKAIAQATPLLGAVGGAAINLAFTEHFQAIAKGHFTIRRLERRYAPALVRREYDKILAERTLRKVSPS